MNVYSEVRDCENRDHSIALAIAVLQERIRRLPKADQDDLRELIPQILVGDDEERASAQLAAQEILNGQPMTVKPLGSATAGEDELAKWSGYFSGQLKSARTEAGLTQERLAELSGIPQSHISRLEKGQHSATRKTVEKLAKALGKPLSYFDPSAE